MYFVIKYVLYPFKTHSVITLLGTVLMIDT